jgi:hypothetical protein
MQLPIDITVTLLSSKVSTGSRATGNSYLNQVLLLERTKTKRDFIGCRSLFLPIVQT